MIKRTYFLLALCFMTVFFASCNQDEDASTSDEVDTESIADEAFVESIADEIFSLGQAYIPTEQGKSAKNDCPDVQVDLRNSTITLDFGDGCTGNRGNLEFQGKLIVTYIYTPDLTPVPTSIITQGFSVNGYGVDGTMSLSNIQQGEQGAISYDLISDLTVTFKDATTYSLAANYSANWTEGFGDQVYTNDVIEVTGSTTGTNRLGRNFASSITTPILRKTSCAESQDFITVSGVKDVQPAFLEAYSINYGNGDCDKAMTITTSRRVFTITLP